MSLNAPFPVTVHPYGQGSIAYEIGSADRKNALIFIGGLGDGPHTVPYTRVVAKHLEDAKALGYSFFELRLRSAFQGFGTVSLADDVADISALVKYLRSIGKEKIILMGHSTGCQDCAEYTNYVKHGNSPVDGFILQAPISDREGFAVFYPDIETSVQVAEKMITEGQADHIVPKAFIPPMLGSAITAYRLKALLGKGGDDDYFSSDLDDATVKQIWSRFNKPVLVLHSGKDEYVPAYVNQQELNQRYQKAGSLVSPLSDLIPNTGHTVKEEEAREWVAARVVKFLGTLE